MITRTQIKEHFGGFAKAVQALGYGSMEAKAENRITDKTGTNIRRYKENLTPRQCQNIIDRMNKHNLPIPNGWTVEQSVKVTEQVIQPVAQAGCDGSR